MNRLVIVGAGGHGKVVADTAHNNGYTDICFVDDNVSGKVMGFDIIGTCASIQKMNDGSTDFVIAVGDNALRKKIAEKYDVNWVTIIHTSAQIAVCVSIGIGTVVMANAVINPCATIGRHCIINTSAVVEHDSCIDDYVHVSPNVALGGMAKIGALTHVGIGSTVKNNVSVCGDCVIGAGATVVDDISEAGVYVGTPARKRK